VSNPKPKRKPLTIDVQRIPGDTMSFTFTVEWDAKTLPIEKQRKIWAGLAAALDAVLTPAESRKLLAKLVAARSEKAGA
jgi:hypothetical protein